MTKYPFSHIHPPCTLHCMNKETTLFEIIFISK
uniref:Uncharacterized protein n=1 Tax=Anguilla anguilla TaxID=7936 RepID=A0A0E9S962_ANGAN